MGEHPEVFARMRAWDELHEGVQKAIVGDPEHWGVLHGDINVSNFFWVADKKQLIVFDWDQCCVGWYLLDLAQAAFSCYMLAEAGMPVSGDLVPFANPEQHSSWMIAGYERARGKAVDRAAFDRMVQ